MLRKLILPLLLILTFSGCDAHLIQLISAGEYGVVFNALPRWMGGGVANKVVQPGEWLIKFPWRQVYVFDTTTQTLGWGSATHADDAEIKNYVETRTVDGNEVGISLEVQYRVDPEKVTYIVQHVGTTKDKIRHLVAAVARADIRTHLNVLTTSDFFSEKKRDAAVQRARAAMNARLMPEGFIVDRVIFRDYKFERAGEVGEQPDQSYQQQIDETQAKIQEIEQEEKRRAAQVEGKGQEYAVQDGERLRTIAWAKGYSRQARVRGDSYLEQRKNEAAQIKISGTNEVEGIRKRIAALSGPGGEAILRLEIAKALASRNPRFVLMNSTSNSGKGGSIDLNRVDTNELIRQAGVFAAISEPAGEKREPLTPIITAPSTPLPQMEGVEGVEPPRTK